jgi:hypothetical protein
MRGDTSSVRAARGDFFLKSGGYFSLSVSVSLSLSLSLFLSHDHSSAFVWRYECKECGGWSMCEHNVLPVYANLTHSRTSRSHPSSSCQALNLTHSPEKKQSRARQGIALAVSFASFTAFISGRRYVAVALWGLGNLAAREFCGRHVRLRS